MKAHTDTLPAPLAALRHHVSGAIARGQSRAILGVVAYRINLHQLNGRKSMTLDFTSEAKAYAFAREAHAAKSFGPVGRFRLLEVHSFRPLRFTIRKTGYDMAEALLTGFVPSA